ncbi:hypothetical protein EJD97_018727 [Solanum chilense]|uniref:DUF4283 domain-containing protein n=1 Tax=Solanum chilense TaxID=4083 RepID=A0A6N2AHD8_SOLCI|nr:hypothetical protein EJD97_018727 [Solanum chilense]
MDIARKLSVFINTKVQRIVYTTHRETEEGLSYADTVRSNKWTRRDFNDAKIQQKGNLLVIADVIPKSQYDSLANSVVGTSPEELPDITLSEIRRWVGSTWRHHHGINIYDLGNNRFLFKFSNRTVAEHVVRGQWFWKTHKLNLQWWSPTSNSIHEKSEQTWIRVVGLPLQLWSQKVFQEMGNFCGGWIRTEEETELRNHLKWARLKVRGDGDSVPNSVQLVHEGLTFKVQIWVEML